MNKIKRIRIVLIILILFSLLLVVFNFYKPPEIQIRDNTQTPVNASMVIEKGEHDIYSKGEKFAHFSYARALQKDKTLEIKSISVDFLKNNGKLEADNAVFQKGIIFFNSKVKGFFPDKKATVLINPPSFLKDKNLQGEKGITFLFPDFKLEGTKFDFNIEESLLRIAYKAVFNSKNLNILSFYNVSYLGTNSKYLFFKNALLNEKKEDVTVNSDLIKNIPQKNLVLFSGKSFLSFKDMSLSFVQGEFLNKSNYLRFKVKGVFSFKSKDISGKGKNILIEKSKANADYIQTFFNSYIFSGVENTFDLKNSEISGKNPYIYSQSEGRIIKGDSYLVNGKKEIGIINPVFRDKNAVLFSKKCLIRNFKTVVFPDNVYGIFNEYELKGSSAILKGDSKTVKNVVVTSLSEGDTIKGKTIELKQDGNIYIKGNVIASKKMRKENEGKIICEYMAVSENGKRADVSGNVSILNDKFKAYPQSGVIFKNYAILFNCNFKIEKRYSGFARLMVINFKGRYSYLFYATVKDFKGNTLKGGKLTLDNVTDRIFIEKTKKKGQVEVKIKI